MAELQFSVGEAFGYGWQATRKHFKLLLGIIVLLGIVAVLENMFSDPDSKYHSFLGTLVFWVLSVVMQLGVIKIFLKLYDDQIVAFRDIFSCWKLFFKYLFGNICYALAVLGGFVCLIVPGVIILVRCQFYSYFIVDKKSGPIEALRLSFKATQDNVWKLVCFDLAFMGILILGVLALLLGLLVAVPIAAMASVFVFRKLSAGPAPEVIPQA